MFSRHRWLKAAFALLAGSSAIHGFLAGRADAQQGSANNFANSVDNMHLTKLQDQLRFGLRCAKPGQLEYVTSVATAVDEGRLPRALVNLVYRWAIEKNPSVPFPYFQYALEALAQRRGYTI